LPESCSSEAIPIEPADATVWVRSIEENIYALFFRDGAAKSIKIYDTRMPISGKTFLLQAYMYVYITQREREINVSVPIGLLVWPGTTS
jgi:hypothetical protein